jgi:CBS domain containing-hemolysin-like protein
MGVSIAVLTLLAILAVYTGTIEAAFSALMRLSLRLTAERGRAGGLGRYLDDPVLLFVPVRLLMGLVVTVATVFTVKLLGPGKGLGFTVLSMAAFVIVFEHLLPLLIVRRDPEKVLDWLLPSFSLTARALEPVTRSLVGLIATLRPQRAVAAAQPEGQPPVTGEDEEDEEATHTFLEAGEHEGLIEREERALLQSIVDFGDTLVREVMTPRPDIVAIRTDATLGELRALLAEEEYSRIPVYRENLDHILGFVHVKDLIRLVNVPLDERVVPRLLRPAYFVPETKRVAELLKEFQRQQVQSAVVVDEYGGTAGLVTIEDLLEEIVGEIRDEFDVEAEPITEEADGVFVVSGKVDIDEVADKLHVSIARDGFDTVGGFLLTHVGRVPAVGEAFDIDGLHIEVLEAERRRVTKVRMRRIEEPAPDADPEAAGDMSGAPELGARK